MKKKHENLAYLFEDCTDDDGEAAIWVHSTLRLQNPIRETFPKWNSDGTRALEFLRFYAQNSDIVGWRKYYLGELVSESLIDAIEGGDVSTAESDVDSIASFGSISTGHLEGDADADVGEEFEGEEVDEELPTLSEEELEEATLILRSLKNDRRLVHFLRSALHPSVRSSYPKWVAFYKSVFGEDSV